MIAISGNFINAANNFHFEYQEDNETTANNVVSNDSLKQLIIIGDSLWELNRKKSSDSLISIVFNIIQNTESVDSIILADAYNALGQLLIQTRRQPRLGIDTLMKSLSIKQKIKPNDYKSLAKTLNFIGVGYLWLQIFDSTFYYYNKSRELLINNNIKDINLYNSYLNIAINYASLGQYTTALYYFDTAKITLFECEEITDNIDKKNDSIIIAKFYYNYALITTFAGKLKEANEYYEKAEDIFINQSNSYNDYLAGINNNKGNNSFYDYEFLKAELYYKKAIEIYIAIDSSSKRIPLIYYNLSEASQNTNDYLSSINYCIEGLKHSPENDLRLILNQNIANSYSELKENDKAIFYFTEALDLLDKEDINPKRRYELYTLYADFLLSIENYTLCCEYYKKALASANLLYNSESKQYANILTKIGNYYLKKQKNPDSAIVYFSKSITILNKLSEDNKSAELSISIGEAQIGYASTLQLEFKKTQNIELLYEADTMFTKILNRLAEESDKLSNNDKLVILEMVNPVYNSAIENSSELYSLTQNIIYKDKILNYTERSKSSALLSVVKGQHALKTSDIPDNIFQYEHQLTSEINGLRQLLEKEKTRNRPNTNNVNYFETELLVLINKYDSLIVRIEHDYPKYYSVKYGEDVITPEKIKLNLEDDEALIEYQLTDSVLFIMVLTNDDFVVKQVAIDTNFYNSLEYIISIKNVDLNKQNVDRFNDFKHHSYKLYLTLIRPVDSLISNKRLIIIPDGLLGYLPFDLLTEYDFVSESINYRDLPYLISKHPISYSYSASLKYNSFFDTNKKKSNNNILAFAPTYSDKKDTSKLDHQLENLPFAKTEVIDIVRNREGTAYYGIDATKNNFLKYAGSNDMLHLAMHTIINDSLPMQSKLVFYNEEVDTTSHYMFTHEIFNMDLNASMVTLSACNTGSGKFRKGEGIMSLARGFVYAGVPSIVMTLWEVQDASGSIVMKKYYEYLKEGMTKDVALRKAKLFVLKDANMARAHPFFWSAYIISGDTTPIEIYSSRNYWITLLSLVLIISLIALYIYKRVSKNRA